MENQPEITRFTGSGKTFFFNKGEASNGTEYLAINALYGKNRRERMVLFPPHFTEFRKALERALEALTGMVPSDRASKCDECGAEKHQWCADYADGDKLTWIIYCSECKTLIDESHPGALKIIELQRRDTNE